MKSAALLPAAVFDFVPECAALIPHGAFAPNRQKCKGQKRLLLIHILFSVKKLRRRGAFSFARKQPADQSRQPPQHAAGRGA